MSDNQEVYSNIDEFIQSLDGISSEHTDANKSFEKDLYKKWFRSSSQSGFLAIRPWHKALKMKIDIGKTSSDGKLLSSTAVFVDSVDFAAYLKSVCNNTASHIYPANEKMQAPTPESFVSFGGAMVDGKPVSRIFKSHHWQSNETYDPTAFVWKCGHFVARKSDSGAFIPDMKQLISFDSIKVTRQDISSISYLMDLAMISHVSNNQDWYDL